MPVNTRILFFLILLTCVGLTDQAYAQRFKGAVIGGVNMSQVDGDEVYGYRRFGAHLGTAAILPLNNWDVTLEVVFNQKGAYQKPQYDADSLTGEYDLRLNYVEVPVLVHYTDKEFISGGIGFSWGALVGVTEIEHGGLQPPYSDQVPFRNSDVNFLADAQIRVWERLKFNIRFAYSILPIREREYTNLALDTWTRKQYNHMWTFRLVYVFNERISRQVTGE